MAAPLEQDPGNLHRVEELQAWVQTFLVDYYQELFRLRGLPLPHRHCEATPIFRAADQRRTVMLTRLRIPEIFDFAPRFRFPGHSRRSANGRIPRNCLRMR